MNVRQQKPIKLDRHEKWYLFPSPFIVIRLQHQPPKKSIHYLFVKTSPTPNGYVPPLENVWRSRLSCQWYFQLPAMTQSKIKRNINKLFATEEKKGKKSQQQHNNRDQVIQQVSLSLRHLTFFLWQSTGHWKRDGARKEKKKLTCHQDNRNKE